MNTYKVLMLSSVAAALFPSCFPSRNAVYILDDDLNPNGAQNQLELSEHRGSIGHCSYPSGSKEPFRYWKTMGNGRKSWVLTKWGAPDETRKLPGGRETLIYTKRSKQVPGYQFQADGHIELTYQGENLLSIKAHFPNCPAYMKGPVYVLPK
jgi:hypothetical protein